MNQEAYDVNGNDSDITTGIDHAFLESMSFIQVTNKEGVSHYFGKYQEGNTDVFYTVMPAVEHPFNFTLIPSNKHVDLKTKLDIFFNAAEPGPKSAGKLTFQRVDLGSVIQDMEKRSAL